MNLDVETFYGNTCRLRKCRLGWATAKPNITKDFVGLWLRHTSWTFRLLRERSRDPTYDIITFRGLTEQYWIKNLRVLRPGSVKKRFLWLTRRYTISKPYLYAGWINVHLCAVGRELWQDGKKLVQHHRLNRVFAWETVKEIVSFALSTKILAEGIYHPLNVKLIAEQVIGVVSCMKTYSYHKTYSASWLLSLFSIPGYIYSPPWLGNESRKLRNLHKSSNLGFTL